ncbi:MAG: PAS domain S-box protein [Syntrophaceae bacterium]|nr:PAS domain S-box protein [Syntrophaceae bacterium]
MRILIAEDDFTSRNVLAGVLEKEGHEVTAAADGAEAWRVLQASGAPALVILDWLMPEMDGPGVVRRVRARQTDCPPYIIMLTTKGEKADMITALDAGADDYLTKPFDPGELRARIEAGRRMLEMREQLAAKVRELSESEENYRHLIQHLHVGVVVHAPDTSILLANQEASRVLGVSLEQMKGKIAIDPAWHLVREDGSRLPLEDYPVKRVLAEHRPVADYVLGVDRLSAADRVWVLVNAFPKFDDRRRLQQIVVTFVDITDRKRSEDVLREADARLRLFVNASKIGLWDWDLSEDEVYFSREWKGQLGYSEDEFPNLLEEWQSRIHPEDLPQAQAQLHYFLEGSAEYFVNDFRMRHKDGSYRWIVAQGRSFRDEAGKAVRVMGCHIDITERKMAEQSLLTSEVRLRTLVHTIPDLVWLKDKDGVYLSCNPVFERLYGARESEIIGKTDYDFVDRELADLFREYDCRVMTTGKPTRNEEWITFADDGHRALLEVVKTPMYDGSGILIGVLGVGRDVTERKHAEEALRESEERVRTKLNAILLPEGDIGTLELADIIDVQAIQALMDDFFALTNIGIGIIDLQGKVLVGTGWQDICTRFHRSNRDTCRHCLESDTLLSAGVEPGTYRAYRCKNNMWDIVTPITLGGKHMGNIFLGQFLFTDEEPDYAFFRAQARKYGFDEDEYIAALERVPRWSREKVNRVITFYARFARMIAGSSYANVKLARTLAEREKIEAQLIQAQKMESVGRLAGGVAHDFNNMLSVILGHAELALLKLDPAQPVVPHLLEIHGAAERSADLTRQLLAFARKQTIVPKVLDLNESVEGMLRMLQRLIGEDLDLAWMPGMGLWPVAMDPSQLDQIMANLCVNARDAIAGEGRITLETANADFDEGYCSNHAGFVPGKYVQLAVSDNGCGMDEETLRNIFEPFFTTKEMGKGTGLGLATVYGIVKQNNGFINVYSEPGHGTTFRIYLPRHADRDPELKESAREPVAGGHETILLVEDQPEILAMARAMLESLGYSVLAANAPDRALRLAEEHAGEISLLLTDVVMPKMNGRDLATRLQSLCPGLICMFMSGYTSDVIAHRGILEKGVHFIQKPFSVQGLAAKVREALEKE